MTSTPTMDTEASLRQRREEDRDMTALSLSHHAVSSWVPALCLRLLTLASAKCWQAGSITDEPHFIGIVPFIRHI